MSAAEQARRLIGLLDLTDLSDAARASDAIALARRGRGRVAAICVWPQFIGEAREAIGAAATPVAAVINFPKGGDDAIRAVEDAQEALRDGARELDLVMPWRAFLAGDERTARDTIEAVRDHVPSDCRLKVILETGALGAAETIARAARLAIAAGADFIKTSTGKTDVGATPEAARIMLETIRASDRPVGFKASGGVRSFADAARYLALAEEIMGEGWARRDTFRIGASALFDELDALAGAASP